jgi:glycosyltransferase involved in cell wall biosynthesis
MPLIPSPVPTVAVVHDLRYLENPHEFSRTQRSYRRLAYRFAYSHATRLIAVSEATRDTFLHFVPDVADKVAVVHHGADHVDCWPPVEKQSHAIAFGHWNNKRPERAIAIWGELHRMKPDLNWTLHVVGVSSDLRTRLTALAAQLGVGDFVMIHPFLADAAFRELFASSQIVLFPSSEEGFGLPIIEGLRLGAAIVASDIPAFREVGGDCLLYGSSDSSFAGQCLSLIEDDALRRRLIQEGKRWSSTFTWRNAAELTRLNLLAAIRQPSPSEAALQDVKEVA